LLGFGKTLPFQFSFGGAISTLARQGGGFILESSFEFIVVFGFILERVWRHIGLRRGFATFLRRRSIVKFAGARRV
jgi:hypothetical protein